MDENGKSTMLMLSTKYYTLIFKIIKKNSDIQKIVQYYTKMKTRVIKNKLIL